MARTHIWYLLPLYRGKVIALCLLCLCGVDTDAQYRGGGNINFDDYKSKDFYFGISLGLNSSKHQVFHSREFIGNPAIRLAQGACLLYTSPSPRDATLSRMPSSA